MTLEELKSYLIEEAEYSEQKVENMNRFQLINAYLTYEGIIGYTDDILSAVEAVYNIKLKEE